MALVALVALTTVIGSSCGGDGGGDEASGDDKYKVVVISEGAKNDKSFSNSAYDGATRAAKEHGLDFQWVGSLVTPEEFLRQGNSLASSGADLVWFHHGAMAVQAREVARRFPDIRVCVGPVQPSKEEEKSDPPNMCYWDVQQHNGSFMAGALVAMMKGVDHIGSVNAFEFAALTRQPEGFALGARCVNPDIKFTQTYIESWTDTAKAKAAAESMISAGADVILSATDAAVVGVYEAARAAPHPVHVIPSYFDQYEQAPDVILTSILHNLDGAVFDVVSDAQAGELEEHAFRNYDFLNGDVGKLADFRDKAGVIGQDTIDRWNKEIVDRVKSGEIKIPDEQATDPPLSEPGAGEKLDPASIGCTGT